MVPEIKSQELPDILLIDKEKIDEGGFGAVYPGVILVGENALPLDQFEEIWLKKRLIKEGDQSFEEIVQKLQDQFQAEKRGRSGTQSEADDSVEPDPVALVAIKVWGNYDPDFEFSILHEIRTTRKLMNYSGVLPHIVDVYFCDEKSKMIVMEWVASPDSKSLEQYLHDCSLHEVRDILSQMCQAMKEVYLVFKYHGDVKVSNFLLGSYKSRNENKRRVCIKLTDFGHADVVNQDVYLPGTLRYISKLDFDLIIADQEKLQTLDIETAYKKKDRHAFFVTMFVLLFGKFPYPSSNQAFFTSGDLIDDLKSGKIDFSFGHDSLMARLKPKNQKMIIDLFHKLLSKSGKGELEYTRDWVDNFERGLMIALGESPIMQWGIVKKIRQWGD